MGHAAENHVRLDLPHNLQHKRRGPSHPIAFQAVDFHAGRKRPGTREVLSDKAKMHAEAHRIKMPRQLGYNALSTTPAEMRDQEQ
jgi:hypothetical protein